MIYSDQFIETNSIFLENLSKKSVNNSWSTASSSYMCYQVDYDQPLNYQHYYFIKFTYKFTTTNQFPTWVTFYRNNGYHSTQATITNPIPNTEYYGYDVFQPASNSANGTSTGYTLLSGQIYQGPSNHISGVQGQVKEIMLYDVTELYDILVASETISNTIEALKTWCNTNLTFHPYKEKFSLFDTPIDSSYLDKWHSTNYIRKGTIIGEFIESDGLSFYSFNDSLRNNSYFDTGSPVYVYKNSGAGTVTHTRVNAKEQGSPFAYEHPYVLKISSVGVTNPGRGGFYTNHRAAADKVFIERFVAKVPVGFTLVKAHNNQGQGANVRFITSAAGTGDWAEYAVLYECGSTSGSTSFSTGGHVYLTGGNSDTQVDWYLAYVNDCDITEKPELAYYEVLKNKEDIRNGLIYTREINECNIFPNGDFSSDTTPLPSGWSYSTTDVAGDAVRSIVQPVNSGAGVIPVNIPVNVLCRYKLSYWIKCKNDMSSFLTAIYFYAPNGDLMSLARTAYLSGTKTTLAADLNTGDTTLSLTNAVNWIVKANTGIGARSSTTAVSYHDKGYTNFGGSGIVSSVSGNVVTLTKAYTGSKITSGTIVVESQDGSNYPYPIQKSMLPSDNTWKYVEGYFGKNVTIPWDGVGTSYEAIPFQTAYMRLALNIYKNTSTEPIKYCDIKIEPVGINVGTRVQKNVQIKEFN